MSKLEKQLIFDFKEVYWHSELRTYFTPRIAQKRLRVLDMDFKHLIKINEGYVFFAPLFSNFNFKYPKPNVTFSPLGVTSTKNLSRITTDKEKMLRLLYSKA